jgi:hypothetical protein
MPSEGVSGLSCGRGLANSGKRGHKVIGAMLRLIDLLQLAEVKLGRYKVHFATGFSDPPLTAFFNGKFQQWQEFQNRKNFQCEKIVSLINYHGEKWLFAGVWNVHGVICKRADDKKWFEYSTSEVPGLNHLSGKTIVTFKRDFRNAYVSGETYGPLLIVSQLLEDKLSRGEFPGYSSTLLMYDDLRHIITHGLTSWRSALKSVAGVYLIVDVKSGKQYVGSAYGIEGLWGRWQLYAALPHGKNIELDKLLQSEATGYERNFQFSILEICDVIATRDEVLKREQHWKRALRSRDFGHNAN